MTTPSGPLARGAIFNGRYEIVRCLKAGGMGAVYEVRHLDTRRRRALKVMLPGSVFDPDLRARFKLEAIVTADVESDHIVETFDAGVDPESDSPFIVMELLRGEDLAQRLKRSGACTPRELVELLEQMAMALDKTHAAGIVHRDLKPENLFLTRRDDGSPCLKILDFGIAKVVAREAQAKTTRAMGTPLYMSPEQLDGDGRIGPAADLYAVGHLAYTLLVGAPYFAEESRLEGGIYTLIVRIMNGPPEPPSARAARLGTSVVPAFDAWFQRATARDPADRFAGAVEQVSALAEVLGVPCRWSGGERPPSQPAARFEIPASSAPIGSVSPGPLGTQLMTPGTMASVWKDAPPSSRLGRYAPAVGLAIAVLGLAVYASSRFGSDLRVGSDAGENVAAAPEPRPEPDEPASPAAEPSTVEVPVDSAPSSPTTAPSSSAIPSAAAPPLPGAKPPPLPVGSPPPGPSPSAVDPTRIRK